MSINPLLRRSFPIPFDRVEPAHVGPAVDALLADAERRLQAVVAVRAPRTFDNTMMALEAITERLDHAMRVVAHLEATATSVALRDAYNEAQPRVSEFVSRIPLSAPLYRAVQGYAASPAARRLRGARARHLERTLDHFRRHGADLDEARKERLAAIDVELSRLTLSYAQNVLDATNAFELVVDDERRLGGLPDSAREAARQSARDQGKDGWRFTLQAPSYVPLVTYADDAALRRALYLAAATRATAAPHDNRPLVGRALDLRREKAELLGYRDFADLALADRMARSGERAGAFIADLRSRSERFFVREREALQGFRSELEGRPSEPLAAWDLAYYAEKLRRRSCDFDEEALRPYFAFERVLEGLFGVAERLFGVRFEPWPGAPSWHASVRAFKIIDGDGGRWLAGAYVDPFPRESKHGGAWMDGLLARGAAEPDRRHLGALVANVTPPVGGRDALLAHRDVETLLHELGHLLHHCLSRGAMRSQAGTRVAWDFVELPSQLLENWCWEREPLDLLARHHETGAPLGDALFAAMTRARHYRAASIQMRQLGFAAADHALHTHYRSERDGDPIAFARHILEQHSPTPLPAEHAVMASFEHLFGDPVGYAAGYYSYKWAEVLEADVLTRFQHAGLLDAGVGSAFRREVLARGDDEDPAVLLRRFLGRDPDPDALLAHLGLVE